MARPNFFVIVFIFSRLSIENKIFSAFAAQNFDFVLIFSRLSIENKIFSAFAAQNFVLHSICSNFAIDLVIDMKRLLFVMMAVVSLVVNAQTPQQMLDRAVNVLKKGGNVSASYSVSGTQGASKGSITMSGTKFRLLSSDMKCWFDGKTMWTYSTMTGEVNVTTPSAADLQMSNPYAAAADFKKNYNMWKAAGQIPGAYAIMLVPKKKAPVSKVYLYIDNKTCYVRNLHVKMTDGSAYTVSLSNYKTGVNAPVSTFTFDKNLVPAGTEVVDLR